MERTGSDEVHDPRWLGAILPICLAYVHLIPQGATGGSDSVIASSLCFTIALISLTASSPLPPSKGLKVCVFHLILGCAVLLSSAAPNKYVILRWLPYFSCIRPFFHLLPSPFQLRILHLSQSLWEPIQLYLNVATLFHMLPDRLQHWILQFSQSVIRQLVTVDASPDAQPSSPLAQPNIINLETVELELQLDHDGNANTIASTALALSSSQAQLNTQGVARSPHPLEDMN